MAVRLTSVNLVGGGADLACNACLPETRAHHERNGIVSEAQIEAPGECCSGCGSPGDEVADG